MVAIQTRKPAAHKITVKSILDGFETTHFDDGISPKSQIPNKRRHRLDEALKTRRTIDGEKVYIFRITEIERDDRPVIGEREDLKFYMWNDEDEENHVRGLELRNTRIGEFEERSAGNMKQRLADDKRKSEMTDVAAAAATAAIAAITAAPPAPPVELKDETPAPPAEPVVDEKPAESKDKADKKKK